MRRTSHFLWHEPASPAVGTYVSKARETATNPPSTGLREALCGLIPGWHEAKHTYGYAYGTESGAARRPRVPFPKSTSKDHQSLEVFKGNGGQSLKSTTKRQGDDGRTCLPSEVLGLASCHSEDAENGRYVVLASQNYITVRQKRLRWLETSEAHSSPLLKTK